MLEQKIKTSWKEYGKVFLSVECGAYIGANAGGILSRALTQNNKAITTGIITGDYLCGTLGQLGCYYHNNHGKFRDKNGNLKYGTLIKDMLKISLMIYR